MILGVGVLYHFETSSRPLPISGAERQEDYGGNALGRESSTMPQEIVPSLCVVPIVGLYNDGGCGPFLGTGFFAGEQRLLVTCDHVLAGWDGAYEISAHEDVPRLYRSNPVLRNTEVDLACLKVEEYEPEYAFPLEVDTEITLNQLVCCYEYGTTDVAGGHINFSPANRLGNVT